MKVISQGAEAVVKLAGERVVKERVSKGYRISEIDAKLRKLRTRSEGKLLQKCAGLVPKVLEVDEQAMTIVMEYISGGLLKDVLDGLPEGERKQLLVQVGKHIATLHGKGIIHGDLTTSNIIVKAGKPYFIDFGLGFVSNKLEDKAVDLHLLKQALLSRHHLISEEVFGYVLEGYSIYGEKESVLRRLQKVENRGRHKQK